MWSVLGCYGVFVMIVKPIMADFGGGGGGGEGGGEGGAGGGKIDINFGVEL